jgi:hypothetical protein
MARNQIENPNKQIINTVEDQNKYQISRNRTIDELRTVQENNTSYNKSNDLLKLADALKTISPVLQEYSDKKHNEGIEKGKLIGLEGRELTEEEKKIAGVLDGYDTMKGKLEGESVRAKALQDFATDPDRENKKLSDYLAPYLKDIKGVSNTFLKSFNPAIADGASKIQDIQLKERIDTVKTSQSTTLLEYINSSELPIEQIFENGNVLGLSNKETKEVVEKHLTDLAQNGDYQAIAKYTNELKTYKSKDGVKVFGDVNTAKLNLTAIQAAYAANELADKMDQKQTEKVAGRT